MLVIGLALLVCILGAAFALAAANPKVAELGKWAFVIGLFAVLCCGGPELVKILGATR